MGVGFLSTCLRSGSEGASRKILPCFSRTLGVANWTPFTGQHFLASPLLLNHGVVRKRSPQGHKIQFTQVGSQVAWEPSPACLLFIWFN